MIRKILRISFIDNAKFDIEATDTLELDLVERMGTTFVKERNRDPLTRSVVVTLYPMRVLKSLEVSN